MKAELLDTVTQIKTDTIEKNIAVINIDGVLTEEPDIFALYFEEPKISK